MASNDISDDELVQLSADGDASAAGELLRRHRDRLRQMIAVRMDPRLSARFDPSDVIQEAWVTANARLPAFAKETTWPFYVWLRQIAMDHLLKLYRHHVDVQKRSLDQEEIEGRLEVSDESMSRLADHFVDSLTGPIEHAMRHERKMRVRKAIKSLGNRDREIIELRYLEHLSNDEIAAVLDISTPAVHTRHFRAIERLGRLIRSADTG